VIYVIRYALIVLYTVVLGGAATVAGLVDRSGESAIWIARLWVRWILWTCRVRVEARGLENVDLTRPHVWMSNHQSVFDIPALVATIPVSWRFVAKRELLRIPFFGWAIRVGGHVIVDRADREQSVRSLREAARRIAQGTNVIIFPEGTRSASGRLRAFRSGGFHLAIEAQVPIVPITVSGSHRITPKRSLRVKSGRIAVCCGKPISTEGLTVADRGELKDRVREAIEAGYDPELQDERAEQSREPRTALGGGREDLG
jgi:1-acyl-sn-glycerol-3-phosphate acyltransferase